VAACAQATEPIANIAGKTNVAKANRGFISLTFQYFNCFRPYRWGEHIFSFLIFLDSVNDPVCIAYRTWVTRNQITKIDMGTPNNHAIP